MDEETIRAAKIVRRGHTIDLLDVVLWKEPEYENIITDVGLGQIM